LDESNVRKNISKIENILIKSGLFRLDGRRQAIELDPEEETVVVDVAEHEIERPKKNRKGITVASKNAIR
jgi:hypothetical protein